MSRKAWFLLGIFLALAGICRGQRVSNWRVYRTADGLPESACASVTVSPRGRVWVRHLTLESVSGLDGYTVQNFPAPGPTPGRVYESPGGQLWAASEDGLQEFRDGAWVRYRVREIAVELSANSLHIPHPVQLWPVRQGRVLFLLPDGLFEFSNDNQETPQTTMLLAARQTSLEKFQGMAISRDGGLWIAGTLGFGRLPGPIRSLKPGAEWHEFTAPESLAIRSLQEPHEDDEGGVTAVADSTTNQFKVVVHFDGQHWEVHPAGASKLRFAWRSSDKRFWAATADSLLLSAENRAELEEYQEVSARQYFDVALDPGGAFWLATSDGLFRSSPCIWQMPSAFPTTNHLAHCATVDADGRFWFASAGALQAIENDQLTEHPFPPSLSDSLQNIRDLFALPTNTLVLDTANGLFQYRPTGNEFSPVPHANENQRKVLGWLKGGSLCLQVLDPGSESCRLESYDGTTFAPLPFPAPSDPAFNGELTAAFTAQDGGFWLGSRRALGWYHGEKWQIFTAADGSVPLGATSFLELPDGKICCATADKVWEFNGHNWTVAHVGFDRINGLLRSHDGSIWVASNNGLHRFFQNAWLGNGPEDGLPSPAIRQVLEDSHGRIWACTTHGLSVLHPEADADPPQTSVEILTDKEKNSIPEGTTVTLAFRGMDKWKYTLMDRLLYSYRLDDADWSAYQEPNNVYFSDPAAGKHYFQVRAMDRNGNVDTKPARLEFAVALPWYQEARLRWMAIAGFSVALFFAGLAFNRHRRLVRSYAEVERKVAERTRQLEIANLELLHSQKMNALGTLAAGIAHDFNNILSIIKGSAQIIEDNLENAQKVRTRLDRIKTVVEQGAGIVKAMLGFSRSSDGQPSLCDLNAVVGETIKLLGDRFLREVEVHFEPGANLPEVPASQDFIQQILLNFIFNAAEAANEHREITLTSGRMSHLRTGLALAPAEAPAYVFISVKDLGCGIPVENMARIFEPFFTTKAMSARRGTGLGLSMVYELARKMDAGLAVESVVNQGSTFTLILPVREMRTEAKKPETESAVAE